MNDFVEDNGFEETDELRLKNLWVHVLINALHDATVNLGKKRSKSKTAIYNKRLASLQKKEAIRYLKSDSPRVFGFIWVCETCGLSPANIRGIYSATK